MGNARRSKADYLWVRPSSDLFWFSRAVPKRLWEAEGRKVIQFSLGTSDRRQAEALARRHASELDERWGLIAPAQAPAKEERRTVSAADLEALAVEVAHDSVTEHEDRRRMALRGASASQWQRFKERTAINLAEQSRMTATGETDMVRGLAAIAIDEFALDLPAGSAAYEKFLADLNAARLAALRVSAERAAGNVEAEADSSLVNRVRGQAMAKARPGETLEELFESWAAEMLAKGQKRADTVNQDRKVIVQFAGFVGEGRAVDSITRIEVADYRDTLRKLPPKWMSNKELRGLGMREAAAKARELKLPETAFTTVNKYLSTISPLYTWLRKQPRWSDLTNPVDGLAYDNVKGKKRRPSFDTATLNKMLQSPLFTGFRADGREHQPGDKTADDWRKWLPLVCLFTGARIGEIAQLRLSDVRQERGVWIIHIRHAEGEGLTTKSGKSRPAAVHPILEQIGFLAFHQRQLERAGNDAKAALFPELAPNSRGQISGEASRWWRDYLTAIGLKSGRDGFGAHSFRHTFTDRLRSEAELLDEQIAVCLGHNQQSTTAGYGELSQGTVTMFKDWMGKLRFDGVDFGHLVQAA